MDKYDKETIKNYLLGRISDEETLAGIEDSLFANEEFTSEIELAEDELINQYVFGNLSAEDCKAAENCFFNTSERQFKLKLTQELKEKAKDKSEARKTGFVETLKAFFRQPAYAAAFAVLLVAAIGFSVYFLRNQNPNELAELQTIYAKERAIQPRISEFKYAPLGVSRGADENQENKNKIRLIEINLLEAVEKNPSAENWRKLGVFNLTQRKFADAVRALEKAAALDAKNAKIANDLGSAYFESSRSEPNEKKSETLAKALENFRRAFDLDADLIEALFNKSLCLQELGLYNEAKESWQNYLEKDSTSDWADEARKNLQSPENLKTTSKTKEQVLDDFLNAYRSGDYEFARKINCQTKEMLTEVWLPDQLTRRYLETREQENIDALNFIGNLEKTRYADFFVAELAGFYSKIKDSQFENLRAAKDLMKNGVKALNENEDAKAAQIFAESASLFAKNGSDWEEKIALLWMSQSKVRQGKNDESLEILNALEKHAAAKKYRWLEAQAVYWIANNYFLQNEISRAIDLCKRALKISSEIGDTYGAQKSIGLLIAVFVKIGESEQALKFLGQAPNAKDLYFYSEKQAWRDLRFAADLFNRLEMFAAAESFAKESLSLANKMRDKADLPSGSLELLTKIYTKEKRFDEALRFAAAAKKLAQEKPEDIKKLLLAKAILPVAELKLQMQNCGEALKDYDEAIQIYSAIAEIKINNLVAHKGRLLCFDQLNQTENMQAELAAVLDLSEQYRSKISTDAERQVFFDNEQIIYDVAVENSLSENDSVKAFEFAESSKARSLLDFIEKNNSFADVSKPLSLTEIQARMPKNAQLVQFAVLRKKSVIWTLTKDEIKTAEIDVSADDLDGKISGYLQLIIGKNDKDEIEKAGKELYQILIKPILPYLDSSKEICLIPDKSLHQLPFAALSSENEKFLLEDFKIFYSPSASVFIFATEKARELENVKNERLLSVGNPSFDKEENIGLPALPSAEEEARTIAGFYPNAEQFSGANATKTNFLAGLPGAEIIHFAGHYVAAETQAYSKLLFSDGDLRSFEIAGNRLPKSKLVVLSACRTGIEKFYKGEGAIGIARTFLAVGTPLVVASRWQVDSEATKDLMIAFHRNRREKNLNSLEALRAAQIGMLRGADENFRQPFFWSAFSLIGAGANY
jgi:CHAT domain-containing protein/cytochrome c-type biogenesis protein CcmH/NrfG